MNDNAIYAAILGLMNLIEYVLLNVFLSHYFEKKRKMVFLYLYGAVFVCVLTPINMQRDLIKNILTSFLLMLITVLIVYIGKFSKKFAFSVIFIALSAIAEVILTFISSFIAVTPLAVTVKSFMTYVISGIGGKLILFFIIFYIVKKYPQYYEFDGNKEIMMLSMFPTAALISAYMILEFDKCLRFPYLLHILTVGFLIMYLFLSVTIFFIYHSALQKKDLENKLLLSEEIKLTSEKIFNQQIEAVNRISSIQHEYKRHLNSIFRYINENQYDELDAYVKSAMCDADKYVIPIPVKFENLALDSLYGRLVQQCTECKIDMTADIRFRKFGFLSEFDACIIFGNLFDNALEACANVVEEKRRIDLTISINQNIVVITLINSHATKIICVPESNLLLSARRGYRSEGFGIKNIQSTLIKYNGYLSCRHTADEFRGIIRMDIHHSNGKT